MYRDSKYWRVKKEKKILSKKYWRVKVKLHLKCTKRNYKHSENKSFYKVKNDFLCLITLLFMFYKSLLSHIECVKVGFAKQYYLLENSKNCPCFDIHR